ncbi:hypothetical protein Pan216_20000 [Planctomycetes bacterium Pan216]|uniref:DUF2029 domain-containing protein n=1 Tax=Kolteria novifilia TaxID=2527975 RepID=A0A518B2J0_9BACT|nr:hypothetical protein Pan216_20000 [Planctomycetes bacterium Pan216]
MRLTRSHFSNPASIQVAWLLWGTLLATVLVLTVLQPEKKTVTPAYRAWTSAFWSQSTYATDDQSQSFYRYPPTFSVAFGPILLLPHLLGETLWRVLGLVLLSTSLWRLSKIGHHRDSSAFLIVTLLTLPASLASAKNGQVNLLLVGLVGHAFADLSLRRWNRSALFVTAAFMLKPLALVPALLIGTLYPRTAKPLLLGLAGCLLVPFACVSSAFVWDQYALNAVQLWRFSGSIEHRFCDLGGMARCFGVADPSPLLGPLRLIAAPLTLLGCALGIRRHGHRCGPIVIFAGSMCYLMLFNPMTETNSYVMLGPAIGLFGAWAFLRDNHPREAWFLTALAIGIGCDNLGNPIHPWTNLWFKAFVCLLFVGYLVVKIARPSPERAMLKLWRARALTPPAATST